MDKVRIAIRINDIHNLSIGKIVPVFREFGGHLSSTIRIHTLISSKNARSSSDKHTIRFIICFGISSSGVPRRNHVKVNDLVMLNKAPLVNIYNTSSTTTHKASSTSNISGRRYSTYTVIVDRML